MKHYTEYTMATNRLKVQKKKRERKKKGKKEDTDRTKLRRFIFSSSPLVCRPFQVISFLFLFLFEKWWKFKNWIRSASGHAAFLTTNNVNNAGRKRAYHRIYGKYDKAPINSLTPRHNRYSGALSSSGVSWRENSWEIPAFWRDETRCITSSTQCTRYCGERRYANKLCQLGCCFLDKIASIKANAYLEENWVSVSRKFLSWYSIEIIPTFWITKITRFIRTVEIEFNLKLN